MIHMGPQRAPVSFERRYELQAVSQGTLYTYLSTLSMHVSRKPPMPGTGALLYCQFSFRHGRILLTSVRRPHVLYR
ncbi:hypothetical protein CERSUDRAFT_111772 [Gelatoporia subvermispora B]|uniref:Uncharacterized protein n=1 Tax=Ceriporiopsis subvermispora (strain B) TaxID=914234 RepID=M2R4I9_CERS8|nr:hypothetical protein CERSUDRAFT_111772 [Gelatoporia subvermispora B]